MTVDASPVAVAPSYTFTNVTADHTISATFAPATYTITAALGTIDLGSAGLAGNLNYTGTGEITDRVINLAGSTGGAVITQAGTGLLKFTSDFTATGILGVMFFVTATAAGAIARRAEAAPGGKGDRRRPASLDERAGRPAGEIGRAHV